MTTMDVFRNSQLTEQQAYDLRNVQRKIGRLPRLLYLNGEPVTVTAVAMGNGHYVVLDNSGSWRSAKAGEVCVTKTKPRLLKYGA